MSDQHVSDIFDPSAWTRVPGFDFTDPDLIADRIPLEELAALRQSAPIF